MSISNTEEVQKLNFADIALPLAARGIPVIPVQPQQKGSKLENWPTLATIDPTVIAMWNQENPDYNVGCVGTPDGVVILDCDTKKLASRIERDTGQDFPPTLTSKSAGKGCLHIYFLQTEASRRLGNRKAAGLFDLQSDAKYVVGPGSTLAVDGKLKKYIIVQDEALAPFPDWLASWIESHSDAPKKSTHDIDRPVDEDFNFEEFCEHYELEGNQEGDYFVTNVCPVDGHKHEGSIKTGFYWDGNSLGFHCFATGCDGADMSISQVIKFLNETHEPYQGVIWPEVDIYEDGTIEIVDDVAPVTVNKLGLTDKGLVEHEARQKHIAELNADIKELEENNKPPVVSEFESRELAAPPKPTSRLAMPEGAMYGYLGDLAKSLQCPLGYAYHALLPIYAATWSGISTKTIRQPVFSVLVGDTSTGKSRTMARALHVVGVDEFRKVIDNALGSGEGLVQALGGKLDKDLEPLDKVAIPVLLLQDEMREMVAKIGIENSSLPYKLNRLWEHDDIGTSTKKGTVTAYAKASFLGGLTVESPQEFSSLFGKHTVSGLYVRNIYGWAEPGWKFDDMWEEYDLVPAEKHPPSRPTVPKIIFDMKAEWEAVNPKVRGQRLSQLALRYALVSSAANQDSIVTVQSMQAALLCMEGQEAFRSVYKPSYGETIGGRMSEMIMEEAWRHVDSKGCYEWFSWRRVYRDNSWHRMDGVMVTKQRDQLVKTGLLSKENDPEHPKRLRYMAASWSK